MKKRGLLNASISKKVDDLRHTDQIIIGDCGLPVPDHVPEIDISLKLGSPSFYSVLEVILEEVAIEKAIVAQEIKEHNQPLHGKLEELIPEMTYVSHEEFKQLSNNVKLIIRTGEATPYANILLQSAVIF